MKKLKPFQFILVLFATMILGCDDSESIPSLSINILEPTDKSETGFTANWTINMSNIAEMKVELAMTRDFSVILKEVTLQDPTIRSHVFYDLQGATRYYIRIGVVLDDGTSGKSGVKDVVTAYQTEKADVVTSDGVEIAGKLYYLASNPEKSPAIILMGHYSITNMWKGEEVFLDLIAHGYVCYLFNYRGHGPSGAWDVNYYPTLGELEEFVSVYARNDMKACYNYLRAHDLVDPEKIGLMGGSLGANESMIGNNWAGVRVSVGMTTSRLGLNESGVLQNILLIASEQDCNQYICFEEEAQYLYNSAIEPKKMIIIPGDFHGLDMFVEEDLNKEILDWINARMNDE